MDHGFVVLEGSVFFPLHLSGPVAGGGILLWRLVAEE